MIARTLGTGSFVALAVLWPGSALAHSPIAGIGAFYNAMLHPVIVPTHAIGLAAVGLLLGQDAPRGSRLSLPAFVGALGLGVAGGAVLSEPTFGVAIGTMLLVLGLLSGLMVALSWRNGLLAALLAAGVGLALGLDTAGDLLAEGGGGMALSQRTALSLLGAWLGAVLVVTLIGGAASALVRPWQKIGIRALGSWIVAAASMVLALQFAQPVVTS